MKILKITNDTPNSGSFFWNVPGFINSGNYIIRIKTVNNSFFDDSEMFSIRRKNIYPGEHKSNINKVVHPLCSINTINRVFISPEKVSFLVNYSFSVLAGLSLKERPASYYITAYIPNSKSGGRLYFSCNSNHFQGIPMGKDKSLILDVIYRSDIKVPPIFKSGTVEFIIRSKYNSEKTICSKKIDFYHEWYH